MLLLRGATLRQKKVLLKQRPIGDGNFNWALLLSSLFFSLSGKISLK